MVLESRKKKQRDRMEISLESIFARLINNKKEVDTEFSNVKINLGRIYQEHESIRSELLQTNQLVAASKEADNMSELVEIKAKVNDIDATVRQLVTDVAVVKNTIELRFNATELRFNATDKALEEIKASLKEMNTDGVTSKRFKITTGFTIATFVIALLACIAVWINSLNN